MKTLGKSLSSLSGILQAVEVGPGERLGVLLKTRQEGLGRKKERACIFVRRCPFLSILLAPILPRF